MRRPGELEVTSVTIFVGRNYSGKSWVLAEISAEHARAACPHRLILEQLGFWAHSSGEAAEKASKYDGRSCPGASSAARERTLRTWPETAGRTGRNLALRADLSRRER